MRSSRPNVAKLLRLILPAVLIAASAGCATHPVTPMKSSPVVGLRLEPGDTVLVSVPDAPAATRFEASSHRFQNHGDSALESMAEMLRPGAGTEAALVAVALLPVAACYGAVVQGNQKISAAEGARMQVVLERSLREAARHHNLREAFVDAANGGTLNPNFIRAELPRASCVAPPQWRLELSVEKMTLDSARGDEVALAIAARARLTRVGDAQPVVDEPVWFRSEGALPYSWTADDGRALRRVADYGFRTIAEQLVNEFGLLAAR